jgi:hypothetical protein
MSEIGSGQGSSYPNAIDTNNIPEVNDPSPGRTKARAEVPNDQSAAIIAVETELGIDPAGTASDVKTYLQLEHNIDGTHDESVVTTLTAIQTLTNKTLTSPTINGGTLTGVSGSFTVRDLTRGLVIVPNSGTPLSQVDIDVTEVATQDTSFVTALLSSVNLTIDITASGINGLDTGSEASSTWYYLWVIYNGTTTAGLMSLSSTAPTMPGGYTFKALVGAVRNDGSSNIIAFEQEENRVYYDANQTILNTAGATINAWTAIGITAFCPPTAKKIQGIIAASNSDLGFSPRSDGQAGMINTGGNAGAATTLGGVLPTARLAAKMFDVRYEDTMYYYTNSAGFTLLAQGWEF